MNSSEKCIAREHRFMWGSLAWGGLVLASPQQEALCCAHGGREGKKREKGADRVPMVKSRARQALLNCSCTRPWLSLGAAGRCWPTSRNWAVP